MSEHGEHESHAGITAEIRARAGAWMDDKLKQYDERLADRLEAAFKREIEATAAKCCQLGRLAGYGASEIKHQQEPVGDAAKLREAVCTLRTALKEIRNDVLDMVTNHKSEDPDSYAHGLCLSIGGACDMALNSTKEFDNAD